MRAVPFSYIARNLWVRRVTTLLTAGGMALVVYVFATVLMMSARPCRQICAARLSLCMRWCA